MKKPHSVLTILLATGCFILFVFFRYAEPIKDGDIWFHMAYGRAMLEHHTLIPDHTIYSWTPTDNNTIYCAWIPEIAFYLAYMAGGTPALFALKYACIGVFLFFTLQFIRKNDALLNPLAWLMILTGTLMCQSAMDIKPEMFSFVFMTVTVWAWFMARSSPVEGWKYYYLLPLIMLLWVNSHGGFIFGLVFLALITSGELMNHVFSLPERLDARTTKHFMISMILCLFAIFITPYGWEYPAQLFHDLILKSDVQVQEFKTVGAYQSIFHPSAAVHHFVCYLIISLFILIILLWTAMKEKRLNWSIVLATIGLCVLYTQFVRTTYFWGILCVFSSIALLGNHGRTTQRLNNRISKYLAVVSLIACIMIVGRETYQTLCKPLFGFWINYYSPIEEAEYIRTNLKGYKLGNDYNSGTYLLWALWPETKVFMDARYFPYKQWYHEYATFIYGKSDTFRERFLEKYPCEAWCATYDFPVLSFFMRSPAWKLQYYGPSACIFVRNDRTISGPEITFDESIYSVRTFQALKILDFSIAAGDIEHAVSLAGYLKKNPICPMTNREVSLTLLKLGDSLDRRGFLDESIFFLKRSLDMSHANEAQVINKIGELYQRKGDFPRALHEFQKALDVQPDFIQAMNNSAITYSLMGNFDRSLSYFNRLVKIQPDNPDHLYNISCVYARQQKTADALYWLDLALKKGFNNWDMIMRDPDLDSIRGTYEYQRLLQDQRKK